MTRLRPEVGYFPVQMDYFTTLRRCSQAGELTLSSGGAKIPALIVKNISIIVMKGKSRGLSEIRHAGREIYD